MFSDFWSWILSVAISTGLVGVIGYFLRDTLSVFLQNLLNINLIESWKISRLNLVIMRKS